MHFRLPDCKVLLDGGIVRSKEARNLESSETESEMSN